MVIAQFSNGLEVPVYQIPVATFINTNGLEYVSGTAFKVSNLSGEAEFNAPGTGGAGNLATSSLEGSNVDMTAEFGKLITSQRAFGLNSQVITAVNEMSQRLAQLKP